MKNSVIVKCLGLLGAVSMASTISAIAEDEVGAVYTMDNAAGGNHVLALKRSVDGTLTSQGMYPTGGSGTGAGLSSQGSVLLSHNAKWLFVCNSGSDEVSLFAVSKHGLQLVDKVNSGGRRPLSLTLKGNLLYVLNAGGSVGDVDNITGFRFARGRLVALPDSTRALSADNTGPAQVSFSDDGNALIVTERNSNLIDSFTVGDEGLVTDYKAFQSVGATPFGFDVGPGNRIFVSEAQGGAANASSASSYEVAENGDLAVISGAVSTEQTAACWLLASRDGRFVYTANAGSGSISGFRVDEDGSLQLLDADGRTGETGDGSHPVDMIESRDGRFFYSLNNGNGTISPFRVDSNGSLQPLTGISGIPTSAAGLAGR
jgi:6-phosphogluconolactonase